MRSSPCRMATDVIVPIATETSESSKPGVRVENKAGDDDPGNNNFTFVEILPPEPQDTRPRTIQAYSAYVEPKDCSKIVKQLSRKIPLGDDLSHLKRVKKADSNSTTERIELDQDEEEAARKRPKLLLQVLVGRERSPDDELEQLVGGPLHLVTVPGRPPQSQSEAREFNLLWPTNFFALKSDEHKEQQSALQPNEIKYMKQIMEQVVATESVILVDPSQQTIVARSNEEAQLQGSTTTTTSDKSNHNPLASPILLAIQGVSRLERQAALEKSADDFSKGQYLCTGYDLYSYYDPTIFEAMACVHSRLRRILFVPTSRDGTVWRHACSQHRIHCLPGTNHKYRAFEYRIINDDSSDRNNPSS
jgi:tRNA-specific adenosine deaminase 3